MSSEQKCYGQQNVQVSFFHISKEASV